MSMWLCTLVTIIIAAVVVLAGTHFFRRLLSVRTNPDEVHYVPTGDGWRITLHRYTPMSRRTRPRPVILAHGLAANGSTFDLPGCSLVQFLVRRGFDCWVLDFRGAGWSALGGPAGNRSGDWNLDGFVQQDIPAAVSHVVDVTGADGVSWVGHSLGGTIILPYMARNPGRVATAVLLSSPSFGHLGENLLWRLVRDLAFLARLVKQVRVTIPNRMLAPLLYFFGVPLKKMIHKWPKWEEVDNMPSSRIGRVYHSGSGDVSRGMVFQASRCIRERRFVSADGGTDYTALSAQIREPVLVVASDVDGIVERRDVEWGFDRIGSETKKLHLVGKATGAGADYGHVDLLLGDRSEVDVYPIIADWLETHGGGPGADEKS